MSTTIHLHFSEWLIITIWPIRPRAHNPIENHVESWRLYDGLTWVDPEKAIRPCTNTALLQKIEGKKGKSIGAFLMNCDLFALTRKTQRKIFLIVKYFLLFSRVRPCIASYYGWTKFSKFSTLSGHVIKCLLTDFGLAGRVNMLAAFSPYIMTSSQNFFPYVRYVWTIFIISYFPFGSGYSREQKKKHQVFYFTQSSSGSSPTTALVTMVTSVCLTCRITGINQY